LSFELVIFDYDRAERAEDLRKSPHPHPLSEYVEGRMTVRIAFFTVRGAPVPVEVFVLSTLHKSPLWRTGAQAIHLV
jgi:hypothetical protein